MSIGKGANMSWVYILRSKNSGRIYIGSTDDVDRRMIEHTQGKTKYVRSLIPFDLVFKQYFINSLIARKMELKLKSYKSRYIIDKIISDGYIKMRG
jgi:putative endonuclease